MLTSNWFAISVNLVTAIVCSAIVLLLVSQLRSDAKSQSFARLMVPLVLIGFFNPIIRFMGLSGANVDVIFMILTVLTACLPYYLFTFTTNYFDVWTRWKRWVAYTLALLIVIVAALYVAQIVLNFPFVLKSTRVSPEGLMLYEYGPFGAIYVVLIAFAELGVVLSLWTAIQQYRRRRSKVNQRLMIGIIVLVIGMLLVSIPGIEHYAFEQIFYAAGSVILVTPVLGQHLFDPISQLNVKLGRRADQLALITRVGQQANSMLALEALLQRVVDDIQQSFRYDGVVICLLNENGEVAVRTASGGALEGIPAEAVTFPIPGQLVYIADVRKNGQYKLHLLKPDIRSSVSIPLSVAYAGRTEEIPIGMLSIQDKRVDAFTTDDLGVLQILARQIAVAIHNAQLFEETQQANKAKTNFISYISHEIRNPVNSILHPTESMLDHPEIYGATSLPDIYRDDIADIDQNARHLKKLLSDVLDLAKIEAGRMEMAIQAIDPLPILRTVQQYAEGLLQPEVLFQTNYPEQLPHVLADDLRLNQVLMNLVGNAVKFTKRGSITISVQAVDGELLFSIGDTGPGIPRETLAKLFNAYTQGAREIIREYGGTGLGLNISKQFVELHRGRIWAESEIGKGTTFYFTIPLAENK